MYPSVSKRRTVSHVRIFPPHGRGERSARRSDCRRSVASIDRQGARPGRVDHIAGAAAQRARQRRLPSARGRRGVHAAPQRTATLETDARLTAYVTDRLAEGWTPEQIAGRLRLGIEPGLRAVCTETIYGWIYRAGQKTERLWRFLTHHHVRRRKRHGRTSRDTIAEKTHLSQRSDDADARETVGHWEADLVICRRSRPVLVLHERKTRITLMTRLAGKTAAETIAAMMATFRRLDPRMRGSFVGTTVHWTVV